MSMAAEQKKIDKKWYVVHTYSGFENKAKKSLEEKIKQNELGSSSATSSSRWRTWWRW